MLVNADPYRFDVETAKWTHCPFMHTQSPHTQHTQHNTCTRNTQVLVNADLYRFDVEKAKWTRIHAPSR